MENEIDFRIAEYLKEDGDITERIVGSRMRKRKVWFTDKTRKNIDIETTQSGDIITTRVMFRDGLKMTDQGFGSGYQKGARNSNEALREYVRGPKTRIQKKFLNKAIWTMVARTMEITSAQVIDTTLNNHKVLKND